MSFSAGTFCASAISGSNNKVIANKSFFIFDLFFSRYYIPYAFSPMVSCEPMVIWRRS